MSTRSFKHKPLNLKKTQIRLFKLVPEKRHGRPLGRIAVYDFEQCPQYRAISYTWGPPSFVREISIDGESFLVRENLWQFLQVARHHADGWLWIDQICIDQTAVDERNHQVSLMAAIYSNAAQVFIWLGPRADNSDMAMRAIGSGCHPTHLEKWSMQALFRRPYWSRLWVLQEILMGKKILVLCGYERFDWEKLYALFVPERPANSKYWTYPVDIKEEVLSLIEEKSAFDKEHALEEWGDFRTPNRRLSYVLNTFAGLKCEDVRDKVYGLLTLVRGSGVIPIDYSKTASEVFFEAIRRIVRDEDHIDFWSHFEDAQSLRERMMLTDISDSDILSSIEEELETIKKDFDLPKPTTQGIDLAYIQNVLLLATRAGQETAVRQLIERGADLKHQYGNGQTILLCAAEHGHGSIIEILLEAGADIESRNIDGQTALLCAIKYGHEAAAEFLLEEGASIKTKDKSGKTLLEYAVETGQNDIVELLFEKGADLGSEEKHGETLLLCAAANGHGEIVHLLLLKGVCIDSGDENGLSPLTHAVKNGHKAVVKLLLDVIADPDFLHKNERTPLLCMTENSHESVAEYLLESPTSIGLRNNRLDQTPLFWATKNNNAAIVKLLLEKGFYLRLRDFTMWIRLLWMPGGYRMVIKMLLNRAADALSRDSRGQRRLLSAIMSWYNKLTKAVPFSSNHLGLAFFFILFFCDFHSKGV